MRSIFAPALKKGSRIGLIAPSGAIPAESVERAAANLARLELTPDYSPNIVARQGYLAGSDQRRANEFNRMAARTDIDAIFCIRGGYGVMRMLPYIDFDSLRRHPKAIVGFSDITALLQAVYKMCGTVGYHAPNAASEFTQVAVDYLQQALFERNNLQYEALPEEAFVLREGDAEGILAGGNLSLVAALAGTPYELDFDGKILLLEDIGEQPYRIDRLLTQLILSGKLQKVKAILLGAFTDCTATNPLYADYTLRHVFADLLAPLGVPVYGGFSFGHIPNNISLPIGAQAVLREGKLSVSNGH